MEPSPDEVPDAFKGLFDSVNLPADLDDKQSIRSIMRNKNRK